MQTYFESGIKIYRNIELQIEPFTHFYLNISSFEENILNQMLALFLISYIWFL